MDLSIPVDLTLAIQAEEHVKSFPQVDITTHHSLHAGVYTRTVVLKAGETLVGALIKIPTTLIVNGRVRILIGDDVHEVSGIMSLPACANRKQVMFAIEDTVMSMIFATNAKTIAEAEEEFTHEADKLMSRLDNAINIIEGV